jgi:uncharacterized membrane protein
MIPISRSITIGAPAGRVFDQLTEPSALLEIWPSLVSVANARHETDGRHAFDWTFKMAGVKFRGHCDTLEVEPGRRRVDHNVGGIPSTFRWLFEPRGESSEVKLEITYEIPALLRMIASPVLRVMNEHEAETLLANLKARLESGVAPVQRRS